MGLPQQIQKQVAAVEAFDKKVAESEAAKVAPAEPQEPQEPQAPAEETPKPPEPPKAEEPPKSADEAALWKQRFLSLQGMYNSQVPALQQQLRDLKAELDSLKQQQTPPDQTRQQRKELVTKNDVEAFGEDLIDVIRRGAREEIAAITEHYEQQIATLHTALAEATNTVHSVADTQAKTQSDTFFSALSDKIPNWKKIQETPECQNFLASQIPGTSMTWNDALVGAASRFELEAVLGVFGQFFSTHPQLDPNRPKPPTKPAARNQGELERLVTPQRVQTSGPASAAGKRMYTGPEYEHESMRVVRLSQQGKHEEAARLESELNTALQEGRVR